MLVLSILRVEMALRKLINLFHRDNTAQMHPRIKEGELIVRRRMDEILRERTHTSRPYHVKVSTY